LKSIIVLGIKEKHNFIFLL